MQHQCCIGTHDIQNISVSSPQPGEVRVAGDFINGTASTALLEIIVSDTNNTDYFLITRQTSALQISGSILDLASGKYEISTFVVEENGLPFPRAATKPDTVFVVNSEFGYVH